MSGGAYGGGGLQIQLASSEELGSRLLSTESPTSIGSVAFSTFFSPPHCLRRMSETGVVALASELALKTLVLNNEF